MGIHTSESVAPIHWRYFLTLEDDLLRISRYIEFNNDNFPTYSIELASILLNAGSEIDVVAKQICKIINKKSKAKNIGHYANTIGSNLPKVSMFKILLPKFGLELQPWVNWSNSPRMSPNWWTSYNNIKHHLHTNFKEANLENTLNAVGGLYVMVLYLYQKQATDGRLSPNPGLFRPEASFFTDTTYRDTEFLINYKLGN